MGIDPDGNLSPFIETGEEAMRFLVVLIGLSTLFVAAGDPVSRAVADDANTCEANFFSGELALRNDAKDEARRLFLIAASDCPKNFIQWGAANEELKALGAAR
jgi:hypothetical protein